MAYQRNWNPLWKEGMEVEYFGAHARDGDEPKLVTIKRISPKLGHATVDVPKHDGTVEERKFHLGHLDYAHTVVTGTGYHSRYRASIHLPSPERRKQREATRALAAQKNRQHAVLTKLVDKTKYHVLNDDQLYILETIVGQIEEQAALERAKWEK